MLKRQRSDRTAIAASNAGTAARFPERASSTDCKSTATTCIETIDGIGARSFLRRTSYT